MRLRTRFTVAGAAAIALLAVAVAPGVIEAGRVDADQQVDARLAAVARLATPGLVAAGPDRVEGDVGVVLLSAGGGSRRLGPLPGTLPDPDEPGWATATDGGQRWRVLTVTVDARLRTADTAPVVVQYATSLAGADRQADRARRSVLLGLGVGVLLAAALSWLVGGWAARPLRRVREATGRLRDGERVPADQRVDDVDDLARTVNELLDRADAERDRTAAALEVSRSFAAAAAHELRTPLTSISTNLDVLEAYPDLPAADRAAVLREQRTELDRLLSLLTGLRELARGDVRGGATPDEAVDLAELADEVVQDARRRHPGLDVVLDAPETLPVTGWRDGLRLLLHNLVDNGLTHGRPPVTVTLGAGADGGARIVVDDAGPGIPAADRGRVLERFVRGPTRSPGLGLGLALVAQQVELHGGRLTVSDAPSGGARVTVALPGPVSAGAPPARR